MEVWVWVGWMKQWNDSIEASHQEAGGSVGEAHVPALTEAVVKLKGMNDRDLDGFSEIDIEEELGLTKRKTNFLWDRILHAKIEGVPKTLLYTASN